jgi:lysozyme
MVTLREGTMPIVLRLTSTNSMADGFKALQLALVRELKVVETVPCVSGAPGRQHEPFIDPAQDFAGSLRPIPEGIYAIGDIQKGTFEAGIGDTWIPLTVLPPYKVNDRSAFGFHLDANRATAPGSAGCVVFSSKQDLTRLEGWLTAGDAPKTLIVDWKLGFLAARGFEDFDHEALAARTTSSPSLMGEKGLALVKHFEGKRLKAYKDVAGIWTIGYGHTAGVREGDVITDAKADELLVADLRVAETSVRRLVKISLTQWQFDALTSFEFNLASLSVSTLLKLLNAGDIRGAADQILRWDKAKVDGVLQSVPGLTRRRRSERHLFLDNELLFDA